MNIAEMEAAIDRGIRNKHSDVPVYVQTPSGEWVAARKAEFTKHDGETVLIIWIEGVDGV